MISVGMTAGVGAAVGLGLGVGGQRIAHAVQEPKWRAYEAERARVPDDLKDRLSHPAGSVVVPAFIGAGLLGSAGVVGSIIEAQALQAGGEAPRSTAFAGVGLLCVVGGALLARAIAGDEH